MYFSTRLGLYSKLLRWDKPIGIFLLLWPTLWALWIAGNGKPDRYIVCVFILGCILMRSAGCAINDFADRHFDGHVSRTRHRPLASGQIKAREALILFGVLSIIAFGFVLTLNTLTILLSFVAVALAAIYPFTKRFTYWPQAVLGMAFAWAVPMAFAAQTNHIPPIGWLLFLTTLVWTLMYDTLYAMTDREEDRPLGIKSTALLFGHHDKGIILCLQILMIALLIVVGRWQKFTFVFFVALFIVCLLMAYQQYLIKDRQPQQCFYAFLNNHWVGLVIFVGIFASTRGSLV